MSTVSRESSESSVRAGRESIHGRPPELDAILARMNDGQGSYLYEDSLPGGGLSRRDSDMDMMRRELDLAQLRISDLHVELGEARRKLKMAIDEISLRERQRAELCSLVESTEEECLYAQERAAYAEEQLRQAGLPVGLRKDGERVALDSMLAIRSEAAPAAADASQAGGASDAPSAAAAAAPTDVAAAPAPARRDSKRKSSGHGVFAGAIEMFRSRTQGALWFHRESSATALGKSSKEARAAPAAAAAGSADVRAEAAPAGASAPPELRARQPSDAPHATPVSPTASPQSATAAAAAAAAAVSASAVPGHNAPAAAARSDSPPLEGGRNGPYGASTPSPLQMVSPLKLQPAKGGLEPPSPREPTDDADDADDATDAASSGRRRGSTGTPRPLGSDPEATAAAAAAAAVTAAAPASVLTVQLAHGDASAIAAAVAAAQGAGVASPASAPADPTAERPPSLRRKGSKLQEQRELHRLQFLEMRVGQQMHVARAAVDEPFVPSLELRPAKQGGGGSGVSGGGGGSGGSGGSSLVEACGAGGGGGVSVGGAKVSFAPSADGGEATAGAQRGSTGSGSGSGGVGLQRNSSGGNSRYGSSACTSSGSCSSGSRSCNSSSGSRYSAGSSIESSPSVNELIMERTAGKRLLSVFLAARLAVRCSEDGPLRDGGGGGGGGGHSALGAGGFDPRLTGGDLVDVARASPPAGARAGSGGPPRAFSPTDFFKEQELLVAQDMLLDMGLPSSPRDAPRDVRALVESRAASAAAAAAATGGGGSPQQRGRGGQPLTPGRRGQEGQAFHNSL